MYGCNRSDPVVSARRPPARASVTSNADQVDPSAPRSAPQRCAAQDHAPLPAESLGSTDFEPHAPFACCECGRATPTTNQPPAPKDHEASAHRAAPQRASHTDSGTSRRSHPHAQVVRTPTSPQPPSRRSPSQPAPGFRRRGPGACHDHRTRLAQQDGPPMVGAGAGQPQWLRLHKTRHRLTGLGYRPDRGHERPLGRQQHRRAGRQHITGDRPLSLSPHDAHDPMSLWSIMMLTSITPRPGACRRSSGR